MADVFNYMPSKSFQKATKARVKKAQFGDGYSQRLVDGINSIINEWSINFTSKSISEINNIVQFFETNNGASYFLWTPPGESTQYKVICQEWSKTYDSHISASLSAKFEQVFDY